MSGTSADGIDATLACIGNTTIETVKSISIAYDESLFDAIAQVSSRPQVSLNKLGRLHVQLGHAFADAVLELIAGFDQSRIVAIGSHGQTVQHRPEGAFPFTMQLGCGATIACKTGIATVTDFRSQDMAAGGQGAPLAPLFHQQFFTSNNQNRAIINIGGIANLTYLPKDRKCEVFGFDTGPGNTLLDAWIVKHLNKPFDSKGKWACGGKLDTEWLNKCLTDSYFNKPPPKSTGKEYFNLSWLSQYLDVDAQIPQNMQTLLTHLTASSIVNSLKAFTQSTQAAYLCGGGVKNTFLVELIKRYAGNLYLSDTTELGLDPDFVEAAAFAWLAKCRMEDTALDTTSITGANKPVVLGSVYLA